MKKLVSLLLAVALLVSVFSTLAVAEEKVTVSLLTTRNSTATNDIEDVWFFKYLAQKMNVDFELEQTLETDQRISLMFASDSVPDLVWGIRLSNNDVMVYGMQEGMLLNWKDLITPELMPNTYQAMQDYPDAFTASTAPDGNIYTLPMITGSSYYTNTGSFSAAIRMYINKDWMDACGITELPTTLDEYLEVLRTFKEKDPMGLGENNIPLIGNQEKDKTFVWNALGFHGTATQAYGTSFDLKDNQLVLPCYTEEAKEFITFYNTLYNEGLISPDYFTLDQTAARGLMASGVCGVLGDSTLTAIGDAWPSWVALSPLTSEVNDVAVAAFNPGYSVGQLYASAYTEHPEVLARIVDYMYSDEGALYYNYGPMKGTEETLGVVDGWYYDENNRITTDKVVNGEFTDISEYAYQYIKSYSSAPGRFDHYSQTAAAMAGIEFPGKEMTIVDKLTGAEIPSLIMDVYTDDNNDGHWRITQSEAMIDHLTAVRLPDVYLTAEQNQRVADLSTVINDYVTAESAKFIVGTRPLSELDTYFEELKSLGIEEYIAIYQEAYAPFLETLQ
jgi:putative aldouronate transport system substrate-binding protein